MFGAGAQGLVAKLNTEGQHRGAVAAAKSLEEEEKAAQRAAEVGRQGECCLARAGWLGICCLLLGVA